MQLKRLFLAAAMACAMLPGQAAAAAILSTFAGPSAGDDFGGCGGVSGTTSAAVGPCQDSWGLADAKASARVGHVGADAHAVYFSGGITRGGSAATYTDTVVFSGPGTGPIPVALNLAFAGRINSSLGGGADLRVSAILNGQFAFTLHEAISDGVVVTCDVLVGGGWTGCARGYNGFFTTVPVSVGLGGPVGFQLLMEANVGVGGPAGTASIEFDNSLDFVTGQDLFVLPAGYTANSDDGLIVNNRFIGNAAPEPTVPEPGTLSLLAAGVLVIVARRPRHDRRREN